MSVEPSPQELYEDAPCGYLSLGVDGTILRANRTFLRSIGHDAAALVGGRRLEDLMTAGSRIYAQTHWGPRLALQGDVREVPVDLVRSDGETLSVLLNAVLVQDADGTVTGIRASLFDATDRRRYERELLASRDDKRAAREDLERLQQLSSALAGAVGVEAVAEALGGEIEAALAPDACTVVLDGRVVHERRSPYVQDGVAIALTLTSGEREIGTLTVTFPADREPGERDRAYLDACAAQGAIALRRAHLYAEMRHRALHDPLTELPNRALLRRQLEHEIARGRRTGSSFALALLDLDDFKLLNDTRGHAAGDEILRTAAARLTAAMREVDMVARLGGDEYVVLCPDVAPETAAAALAARIGAALGAPLTVHGVETVLRASIGVVVGDGAAEAEQVMRDADVAMYAAKERGHGQAALFDASMRERAAARVRIEEELRVALREDQLRVFYQPLVCAADGTLAGMEALVRWEHPERGLVPPGAFIPVAEDTGLVVDVGGFVLREACRQLAAWHADGVVAPDVGVTVNIAARQLAEPGLIDDVAAALADAGLDGTPSVLGLVITETVLMSASDAPAAKLAELSALGVWLLLDDFGTGASSLARLKRFPVDTVKIDRVFVSGLGEGDGEDDAIVAAVVALAGALGLDVVAEGVETDDQLARLRHLGATKLQGYLFARPLPADELRALLRPSQAPAPAGSASPGGLPAPARRTAASA